MDHSTKQTIVALLFEDENSGFTVLEIFKLEDLQKPIHSWELDSYLDPTKVFILTEKLILLGGYIEEDTCLSPSMGVISVQEISRPSLDKSLNLQIIQDIIDFAAEDTSEWPEDYEYSVSFLKEQ